MTLTYALENTIDVFQSYLLQKMLDIWSPYKIRSDDLISAQNKSPWVRTSRVKVMGRASKQTPCWHSAQQALPESLCPTRRSPGKPKTMWVSRVKQDLKELEPKLYIRSQALQAITHYRVQGRHLIISKSAVPTKSGT